MVNISSPKIEHELFMSWVKAQGVGIFGVEPAQIEGHGLGIVAHRKIEAGEDIVRVPASALLSTESICAGFRDRINCKDLDVHGLLASFLAFGGKDVLPYAPWQATWPSPADFRDSMPVLWPLEMRDCFAGKRSNMIMEEKFFSLPPNIGGQRTTLMTQSPVPCLLLQQEKKLKKAWTTASKVFPDSTYEAFSYFWLVVNTRSFYFELPGNKVQPAREDRMVLCPFVDYFNHADHGCKVSFNATGFTVTSDRTYDVGEEIYTSYGRHSNDFLMVEYGFILDTNKWDSLPVTDLLLPMIKLPWRHRLERAGYLGDYTVSPEGVCHRTQVAVRTQTLTRRNWSKYVAGLEVDDADNEVKADALILSRILEVYYAEAEHALICMVECADRIKQQPREVLVRRWSQIKELVVEAVKNGINATEGARFLSERIGLSS